MSLVPEYVEICPDASRVSKTLGQMLEAGAGTRSLAGSGAVWAGRVSLLQGIRKRFGSITPKFVLRLSLLSFCSSTQDEGVPSASEVTDLLKSTQKCMLPSRQDRCTKEED